MALTKVSSEMIEGGSSGGSFSITRQEATNMSFPNDLRVIRTEGYASVGDGGGARYIRSVSVPPHSLYFQSLDGAYWVISEDYLRPEMATGSSALTDVGSAINLCIAALPANGGVIRLRVKTYNQTTPIVIGDGSVSTSSTKNGICLIGDGGQAGTLDVETVPFSSPTTIKWTGIASEIMLRMNGPIWSCLLKNIMFDCNSIAAGSMVLYHPIKSEFSGVGTINYTSQGAYLDAYKEPASAVIGSSENTFFRFDVMRPTTPGTVGMVVGSGQFIAAGTKNLDVARCNFHQCRFDMLRIRAADNCVLKDCNILTVNIAPPIGATEFPFECSFIRTYVSNWQVNLAWGPPPTLPFLILQHPIGDNGPAPTSPPGAFKGYNTAGQAFGGFLGLPG